MMTREEEAEKLLSYEAKLWESVSTGNQSGAFPSDERSLAICEDAFCRGFIAGMQMWASSLRTDPDLGGRSTPEESAEFTENMIAALKQRIETISLLYR